MFIDWEKGISLIIPETSMPYVTMLELTLNLVLSLYSISGFFEGIIFCEIY